MRKSSLLVVKLRIGDYHVNRRLIVSWLGVTVTCDENEGMYIPGGGEGRKPVTKA